MPLLFNVLIFLFCIVGSSPSWASAGVSCTSALAQRAESLLIHAREDWGELFKHQRKFASCDDGALGEGYSDAVVYLFAQKWGQFNVFVSYAKKMQYLKTGQCDILILVFQVKNLVE